MAQRRACSDVLDQARRTSPAVNRAFERQARAMAYAALTGDFIAHGATPATTCA